MRRRFSRGLLAAVAGGVMAAVLAFVPPAAAQDRRGVTEPTLTVRGSGQHEVKPDFATLSVDVVTPGDTLDKAANAHEARATRALDALTKLAAEGVKVTRSNFRLMQDSARPNQTDRPFRAVTTFELELRPIERVNALVSRIAGAGLFEVGRIGWRVDNKDPAVDEARRKAIADARRKAEVFAAAAEMRLIGIISITDGDVEVADGQADLPLPRSVQITPPAALSYDASATVTWRIGPRQ